MSHPHAHNGGVDGATISVVLPSADEIDRLDGPELDQVLWQLEQVRRQIESTAASVVERCEHTGHFSADGHRTVRSWTMAVTNCSPGEAARRHRSANMLRLMPAVRAEFRAGRDRRRSGSRVGSVGRQSALS